MDVEELAHLRRARDLLDREYARPLDVPAMARAALMSPACTSLVSFSASFARLVGESPSAYRARDDHAGLALIPPCVAKSWTRPSRIGEARGAGAA
jgi:AraC-like DNA-binding protein